MLGFEESDGVVDDRLVDGDGSVEVLVGLLLIAVDQHLLCFFLIVLPHCSPPIYCALLASHKSTIEHAYHLNLVQLEQI